MFINIQGINWLIWGLIKYICDWRYCQLFYYFLLFPFYLLYKEFLIKTLYVSNAEKKHHLRHFGLRSVNRIKIIILSGLAYVKFNLDNGEVLKKDEKSVLFSLISVYNMFTKREEHTDDSHISALCVEVAPPPILLTSF